MDQFGNRYFAPNVGSDDTIVFERGSLSWQSSWSSTGPNPFALTIPLTKPFQYNPGAGSLVVDMYVYAGSTRGLALDAAPAQALGEPLGGLIGSPQGAAMMEITYFPIPETTTANIILAGLIIFITYRKYIKP